MEQADNGENLHLLRLDPGAVNKAAISQIEICGQKMTSLELEGFRREQPEENAPLYAEYATPQESQACLKFIPYYAWANRGEGEMSVWVRI